MNTDQFLAVLIPAMTAIVAAGLTYLATHRNTTRQERADAMTGYAQLCDDLRAMIELNNQETARLRQELADLKCRFEADREAWRRERQALQARIAELEAINQRLVAQLEALQARADGKECHGS
jgi:chromosome segregation ATPase